MHHHEEQRELYNSNLARLEFKDVFVLLVKHGCKNSNLARLEFKEATRHNSTGSIKIRI